jgi:hypothetical protein
MSILDVTGYTTLPMVIGRGSMQTNGTSTSINTTFGAGVLPTTIQANVGGQSYDTDAGGSGGTATGGQVNITGAGGTYSDSEGEAGGPIGGKYGRGAQAMSSGQPAWIATGGDSAVLVEEYSDASLVSGGSLVPTGVLNPYAGATAPAGWLLCFGQSISRTVYSTLFTAIGTTYGTASGTTFNLPDMRGRAVAGQDDMGGTSADRITHAQADALGGVHGTETHMHSVTGTADLTGGLTTNEGAGSSIQPTIFLNYIIKT